MSLTTSGDGLIEAVTRDENLQLNIFSFFDAQALVRCQLTCQTWNKMGNRCKFWRELCILHWGLTPENFDPPPSPTKTLYELHHRALVRLKRYSQNPLLDMPAFARPASVPAIALGFGH